MIRKSLVKDGGHSKQTTWHSLYLAHGWDVKLAGLPCNLWLTKFKNLDFVFVKSKKQLP